MSLDVLLDKKKKYLKYPLYSDVVEYLRKNGIGEVVLFGASEGGKEIYQKLSRDHVNVSCFCDNDSTKWGKFFLGEKIISPSELSIDDFILISSSFQDEIYCQLRELGLKKIFHFPMVDIITKNHYKEEIIYENEDSIKKTYHLLKDAESKKVFESIILYRLTNDLYFIKGISQKNNQYFPEIVKLSDNEVYVDIGAYDGDTLKIFLDKTKKLNLITAFVFEPDELNYQKLLNIRGNDQRIECYKKAVFDENKTISFNSKGDQSFVAEIGSSNTHIEAITLDTFFKNRDKPTYIKMDIEGSEAHVINGAKKIISENLPKLAVSVYHKSDDLWAIPKLLNSITSSYDLYLRHHSHNICDTVLYCLPKSNKS